MSDPGSASLIRRLCSYYLSCLANDDAGGVSVPLKTSGDPEHVELPSLELDAARLPGWNEKMAAFVNGRRAREPGVVRLGYPVFLSRGRFDGDRRLMPLFLMDVAIDSEGIEPDWRTCSLNLEAVRELEGNGVAFAQHAVMELEEGLGLDINGEPKPFANIVECLKLLRGEWPWAEPESDQTPPKPLSAVSPGMIYERGILVRLSRPYTQGLEVELQKLAQVPEHALYGTALGALLFGDSALRPAQVDQTPLLEVLPMNPEQRAAVRMSLTEPLSIIHGSPGTGKSQVVADLLVNCAWRKKPVLFTSKNNKAVDVVDERINSLGRKPVMVRLGAKEHRHKLAEHLSFLINGTVTPEELEDLKREQAAYDALCEELAQIDEAERAALEAHDQLLRLFGELNEADQAAESRRLTVASQINLEEARAKLFAARDAYLAALPGRAPRWQQFLWFWFRQSRNSLFEESNRALTTLLHEISNIEAPQLYSPEEAPEAWKEYLLAQSRAISRTERLAAYAAGLRALREVDFGDLAERRNDLQARLVQTSAALWQAWITAQPALLKSDQRTRLARYNAVLKSVTEAGGAEMLPDEVRREYERITLEAPEVVSCFAVTALSVRNRVPFTPGYFDLVVFDESSQCDIASALPILFRAKRAVIIGDPQQLQHIASLRRDRDAAFMVDQKLETTHLDWQYSTQSLFSVVAARVEPHQKVTLRDHHRSHPHVIGYSNHAFYDDSLRIVTMLPRLKRFTSVGPAVRWIDVKGKATRGQRGSVHNPEEAKAVVEEIRRIVKSGYTGTIGVVAPFNHQADTIRRELERDRALWEKLRTDHDFQAATAHGFQGDERDLMIFSVVAAPGLHEGALRFLEDDGNVFNVAITRARAELVVVGDRTWCLDAPVIHLRDFARYVAELAQEPDVENATAGFSVLPNSAVTAEIRQLAQAIEKMGFEVALNVQIEQYRVDLIVMSGARRLALDVEDRSAPGEWGAEALEREQLKRQRLLKLGWMVARFWPLQVRDDSRFCLEQIRRWLEQPH